MNAHLTPNEIVNTLAAALPAGTGTSQAPDWSTYDVAAFQAVRLAEAGYVLVKPSPWDELADAAIRRRNAVLTAVGEFVHGYPGMPAAQRVRHIAAFLDAYQRGDAIPDLPTVVVGDE